jgi:hypothetical protein
MGGPAQPGWEIFTLPDQIPARAVTGAVPASAAGVVDSPTTLASASAGAPDGSSSRAEHPIATRLQIPAPKTAFFDIAHPFSPDPPSRTHATLGRATSTGNPPPALSRGGPHRDTDVAISCLLLVATLVAEHLAARAYVRA